MRAVPGFNPQQQLDGWCQAEAQKQGKKAGRFGNGGFSDACFVWFSKSATPGFPVACRHESLADMEQQARSMTTAYMTQDLKQLEQAMNQKFGTAVDALPEEEDALIYHRNTKWVESMPAIMHGQPTLFAVGCGHLIGGKRNLEPAETARLYSGTCKIIKVSCCKCKLFYRHNYFSKYVYQRTVSNYWYSVIPT